MMDSSKKDNILKRFEVARMRRKRWDAVLSEAYRYVLPQYEDPVNTGADNKGAKRGVDIFDSTAPDALDERANRTRGMLFPKGRRWMFVRPEVADASQEVAAVAEHVFDITQAAFEVSNMQTEIHQSIRDAYISTGVVALDVGDVNNPFSFEALPIAQVIPEEASDGTIRSNFREYELSAYEIPDRLPDVKDLPSDIQQKIKEQKNDKVAFIEAQVFDPSSGATKYKLFLKKGQKPVDEKSFDIGRLIVFRADKVPGETMGRGPVLRALPDIKTANKIVELVLKNASIAVTGIWQADDDGVLNPANIQLKPGTIIPKAVGSQGLTPLQSPGSFDVSQIVLKDLQEKIRRMIYGPALPGVNQGIRTAYETSERKAEQMAVEIPSLDRIEGELFRPLVRRALYVLSDPSLAASTYYIEPPEGTERIDFIDMLMEALETPSERAKRQVEAQEHMQALQTALSVDAEGVMTIIKREDYWRKWLKNAGVDSTLIKSARESQAEQQQAQQQAQQQQLAQLAQSGLAEAAGADPAPDTDTGSPAAAETPPSAGGDQGPGTDQIAQLLASIGGGNAPQ